MSVIKQAKKMLFLDGYTSRNNPIPIVLLFIDELVESGIIRPIRLQVWNEDIIRNMTIFNVTYNEFMNTEYSKLTPLRLSLSYEQICDEYRLRLCNQFYIDWNDTYWIVDRVGGVLDIQSYYTIDMDELRYIVDNSMTFEDFEEWYEQLTNMDNANRINLRSWLMGARPELFNNKP